MKRPTKFEHFQFVGDKRSLIVYDVDSLETAEDEAKIAELMEAGTYQSFGPDTAVEARNRGFKLYRGSSAD